MTLAKECERMYITASMTLREGSLARLGEVAVERADDLRQGGINALGKRNVLTLRLAEQTAQFLRIVAGDSHQQIIACDAAHKNTFRFCDDEYWYTRGDLNPEPLGPEPNALSD